MATKDFVTYSPDSGNGNNQIDVNVQKNTTENIRTLTLTINGKGINKDINIKQFQKIIMDIYIIKGNFRGNISNLQDVTLLMNEYLDRKINISKEEQNISLKFNPSISYTEIAFDEPFYLIQFVLKPGNIFSSEELTYLEGDYSQIRNTTTNESMKVVDLSLIKVAQNDNMIGFIMNYEPLHKISGGNIQAIYDFTNILSIMEGANGLQLIYF